MDKNATFGQIGGSGAPIPPSTTGASCLSVKCRPHASSQSPAAPPTAPIHPWREAVRTPVVLQVAVYSDRLLSGIFVTRLLMPG